MVRDRAEKVRNRRRAIKEGEVKMRRMRRGCKIKAVNQ